MKAAYFTLGCKLNFAETSAIGRALAERGVARAADGDVPDIVVVNTCSVTAMADKKCRQLIARLHRRWPGAHIVATGCYAQLQPRAVAAMPGVSAVLGAGQKLQAVQHVEQWLRSGGVPAETAVEVAEARGLETFEPSCERGDRTRWFLKVQDGCDRFCTYCTIPLARGRSRSPRIAAIRSLMPHAFIGVDVIAGARGETAEEWERSYRFIAGLDVTRLHVFPYSERPDTAALRLDHAVDQAEKHRRVDALMRLSDSKLAAFAASQLGQVRPVLWEASKAGVASGLTDNYLRVHVHGGAELHNTITNARLLTADGESILAQQV